MRHRQDASTSVRKKKEMDKIRGYRSNLFNITRSFYPR
nr:MAG TPA: hypothetical protein [Caudoviricetes sp.]